MTPPTPPLTSERFWPLVGAATVVALALDANGHAPALEFFRELAEDRNRHRDLAAVERALRKLAEVGRLHNREQFKMLDSDIFEVKARQIRVLLFFCEGGWFLATGCVKKKDRLDPAVLERAVRLRREHLSR